MCNDKQSDNPHLSLDEIRAAVFSDAAHDDHRPRANAHLATCEICRDRVENERTINPLYFVKEETYCRTWQYLFANPEEAAKIALDDESAITLLTHPNGCDACKTLIGSHAPDEAADRIMFMADFLIKDMRPVGSPEADVPVPDLDESLRVATPPEAVRGKKDS